MPWPTASSVAPSTLPSTIAMRETGATSTDCRNPSRRSSITEIVEKIAVKRRIIRGVPGRNSSATIAARAGGLKTFAHSAAEQSQKTIGVSSTSMMRWQLPKGNVPAHTTAQGNGGN